MVNYLLYRIGQGIALFTPLKIAYRIAVFFADVKHLFSTQDRKEIEENLRVIFPKKSDKEIYLIRRRLFRNFAKYLVDFFRFSKIDSEYIKRNIKIENLYYLDEAWKKKKGIIVLTAHMGNWELGGVVISISGYPFWVVALPHKDKEVDKFFNQQRESKGIHVIPFGKAARQCLDVLNTHKMLALVGDRDFSEKGIVVDFFGKDTLFPAGPAVLAMRTKSIVVPGFMFRNPDDTFTLRIEKPIEFNAPFLKATGKPSLQHKELVEFVRSYKSIFEEHIRKYPDQWYMFRRFWIP